MKSKGTKNDFVHVTFDLTSAIIVCSFLNQQETLSMRTCTVIYNQSDTCGADSGPFSQTSQSTTNIVTIGLPLGNPRSKGRYCFVINANNGSHTAIVKGILNAGNQQQ